MESSQPREALARPGALAWSAAALTAVAVALMVLGALVRAHGAGLACPDWPLCFGQLVPSFDLRVAFEWAHRALAGAVSLGVAALTWALWRRADLWPRVRSALAMTWVILAAQVVLGGLTVLLKLAPWTVTAHLLGGTSFSAGLLWITCALFERPRSESARAAPAYGAGLRVAAAAAFGLLVLQLVLGGLVSSQGAGLACPDVPWCSAAGWVPAWSGLAGLHMAHRANGVVLVAAIAWLWGQARRSPRCAMLARIALRIAVLQVLVGTLNVVSRLPVEITALHSFLATAIALTLFLVLREVFGQPAARVRELPSAPLVRGAPGADALR